MIPYGNNRMMELPQVKNSHPANLANQKLANFRRWHKYDLQIIIEFLHGVLGE